jgi:hypothetical protein
MQLEAIEMEAGPAREALRQYRADLKAAAERSRTEADRELAEIDAAVMRGYRELARGRRVLELTKTIAAAGVHWVDDVDVSWWSGGHTHSDRISVCAPALAIARADARTVWVRPLDPARPDDGFTFQADGWQWHPRKPDRVVMPGGLFNAEDEYGAAGHDEIPAGISINQVRLKAMAPTIPPPLRPAHALRNYHLLWEAEWAVGSTIPPGDPALLKHLGGDMYAVLGVWDLTPLERAALAMVRTS